jgi:transcription elongation GreA/GreB family factor
MEQPRPRFHGDRVALAPTSTAAPDRALRDDEGLLAALERAGVEPARVAQVASLMDLACTLDSVATTAGGAGVGAIVRVADRAGRVTEYELLPRPDPRQRVAVSSPVGRALLGARPGDLIPINQPNGRRRRVRVLEVQHRDRGLLRSALGRARTA